MIRDLLKSIAHFNRLITCKAQKQDPTLPHVYSTGRLLVEVFDTKVAIRAQDRPHSRFLNLASLPISRIVIIAPLREFPRRKREEKKSAASLLYPSIGFPGRSQVHSIAIDRVPELRQSYGDRSSTEVRARLKPPLPFRSARTFARFASLREEFSRASPNAQMLPRSFSESEEPWIRCTENLSSLLRFLFESTNVLHTVTYTYTHTHSRRYIG